REVDVRKEVDAHPVVAHGAEDDRREDEHGREDGTLDEGLGEAHRFGAVTVGLTVGLTTTAVPSATTVWPRTRTRAFDSTPVTSICEPKRAPGLTMRTPALPFGRSPSKRSPFVTPAKLTIASSGTRSASSWRVRIEPRANMCGRRRALS